MQAATKKRPTSAQKEAAFAKAAKLWQILKIALEDLAACERSKTCTIDMTDWYVVKLNQECSVCLAGAVMRQRLKPDDESGMCMDYKCVYHPDCYSGDDFTKKLDALNSLRQGRVSAVAAGFMEGIDAEPLDRIVAEYDRDNNQWWEDMRRLLKDLRKAGV